MVKSHPCGSGAKLVEQDEPEQEIMEEHQERHNRSKEDQGGTETDGVGFHLFSSSSSSSSAVPIPPRSRTTSRSSRGDRLELSVLSLINKSSNEGHPEDSEECQGLLGETSGGSPDSSQFATPTAVRKSASEEKEEDLLTVEVNNGRRSLLEERLQGEGGEQQDGEATPFLLHGRTPPPPSRNAISTPINTGTTTAPQQPSSEGHLRVSRLGACPETAITVAPTSSETTSPDKSSEPSYDCSPRAMCGPRPWRVTLGILVALAIWGSIVMAVHIQKKVSTIEHELIVANEKLADLQATFLSSKEETASEIMRLEQIILKSLEKGSLSRDKRRAPSTAKRPKATKAPAKAIAVDRAPLPKTTRRPAGPPPKCTESGTACVPQFTYKGSEKRGCLRDWTSPGKRWCPTRVDQYGHFISGDDTAWGYCDDTVTSC